MLKVVDTVTGKGDAPSWLASNLNQGHLDYYYWLLAALDLINYVNFVYGGRSYTSDGRQTVLSH